MVGYKYILRFGSEKCKIMIESKRVIKCMMHGGDDLLKHFLMAQMLVGNSRNL